MPPPSPDTAARQTGKHLQVRKRLMQDKLSSDEVVHRVIRLRWSSSCLWEDGTGFHVMVMTTVARPTTHLLVPEGATAAAADHACSHKRDMRTLNRP